MSTFAVFDRSGARLASPAKWWAFQKRTVLAFSLTLFGVTQAAQGQASGKVDFGSTQVPVVQKPLTLIQSAPQGAPTAFLQEALGKMGAQTSKIGPLANSALFANRANTIPATTMGLVENNQLRAYWDEASGEAEIFPLLDGNTAAGRGATTAGGSTLTQKLAAAVAAAEKVFGRTDVIPQDATQFTVGAPRPVMGASASRTSENGAVSESASSLYLTYVSLQRKVDGLAVYGPGSTASVAIGNDGSVQGFVKRWNPGTGTGSVQETRTPQQVQAEIVKLLQPLTTSANVTVRSLELAYYDDGGGAIQPVYRITVQVHFIARAVAGVKAAPKLSNDEYLVRYLPVGNETLTADEGGALPSNAEKPSGPVTLPADDPSVGRYVVRNDDAGWVGSANGFWSNITASPNGHLFSNLQYFWAYPYEFNTSELSYVNSVNVALNEVHGDWWYFTTYQDWGDGVDLTAIPASEGFGPAAGGQLNYWILHSCEVVPSSIDAPCATDSRSWWTPWFNIFRGLHTVVGYRTIMYINDGATSPFAKNLELGAPVISAWFNATNGASDYSGDPKSLAHCGQNLPMGRPSAVTVCGHSADTIFNEAALPAASCLTNYWQPN